MKPQSQVFAHYPHLIPGLCGRLECPRLCVRAQHCEAGKRREKRMLAEQAVRRYTVKANAQQERICVQIHKAGLCPSLCNKVGGCFLPQILEHPSEAKRKVFRAQQARDLLIQLQQFGRPQNLSPRTALDAVNKLGAQEGVK